MRDSINRRDEADLLLLTAGVIAQAPARFLVTEGCTLWSRDLSCSFPEKSMGMNWRMAENDGLLVAGRSKRTEYFPLRTTWLSAAFPVSVDHPAGT